jgi:PAS domain S-box-containing protein
LLQLLIDNLPDFIFMKDRQSRFLVANQATARFMGADSPDQLIGKTDFDFYPQEPAAQYFAAEQQIMQTGKNIFEWDRPQLDLAQNEQWLSGTKIALYDGQGQVSGLVGIERDVTERKHAEDALRESESRYRLLVETSIEGIWIMDREHRTSYVNQSMADMLGYEPAEMLGKKVEEFFFPEDMEFHQTRMEKRHGGHDEVYERRFRRRDGSQLWTLVSARAQKDFQGNFNGSFAMFTDITERKQAQEQLSKNERILRLFVEHTPAAIAMFDREMRYIVTSERYLIDFRLGNQDLAGRSHYDVFPEMDDERKEIHQRCLLGAVAKNEADMLPRVDGSTDWVRYELRPWHDTNGEIGGLIFFSEVITERKHAEEALNKTQSLLTEAQRIGHIGHIEWSVGNRALICSEEIYAILGLPRETVITQNTVAPMMTDGERDRIRQLDIQSLQQRKDMDYEYRIRLKDGCERWLHQMGKITYDENGAPIRMLATIQDITERKRAEQALHESEEKYRGLLESLDSVVTSVDINGVFLYMNDIAAKQLGGMPAQFIGKTMYELFPKYAASLQMRDIQTVVDADQGMVVESPSLVNGKSRWYRTSIQPLHEENGQVVSVLVNSTDIHDLKAAQQELQDLNRTLEEKVAQRTAEVQDLYDNAPTGYHSLDANGNFVLVNQTELNWLGYAREEMIGHAAWEFMTEDSRGIFREKFPLFLQQGWLKDIELEFVRKDGSLLPVSLSATAICDEAGNLVMSRSTISDITERKEAENTLRESEETYRALFENSNDAIFLMSAVDGAFVKVNPRCSELLGYPAVKLIGKNSTEFVDPQEAEDSQHRLSRLFSGERMPAYERRLIRNGGEVVETDINLSLIRDASGNPTLVQSVVRDITARKKAERALRESEEQNRLLFEESPVPIALLDDAGHIIHANRAYEQLTGFLRSDLYGKTSVELGLVDAQVVNRLTEAMLQSMSSHENFAIVEYSLTSSDGTRRIVESRVYLLPIQSTNRILVTSNDISMHKQAEETLRRANVELERAMQMKDEFLATMSHELRTPLTGILGLSESLQMEVYGGLNDRQVKTVKNIENSGRHLLELINDVLDLSKVEAGKLELQVARCSLEEICQASLHLTKGMAHQKQQHVNYSAPIAPIILDVDSRRIKQAIVNLFSNAIKFTPQNGELGLTVEPDKENCQVRLIVWDKGIGIKTENLSRLFQPFTQIDGSLAREYTGTGLGLALVRRLVELHDGSVTVESVFGEGSRFIITLPWTPQTVQVGSSAAGDHEESHPETIDENSSLPMILVADDNQVLLDMLGDFLETQKYRTAKVQSGQELLEKIASIEPDIILMDIQMPGMDGLEAIRRVRNHKEAVIASTIIIAVTALAMPGDRERCLDAGANEYMSKPVNLKKLVAVIQDLTGVR